MIRPLALALAVALPAPGLAETEWDAIARELYGTRDLLDGGDVIAIDAPYRSADDARTEIAAQVAAPPGRRIAAVTLVLDRNPMPVSAVLRLNRPQPRVAFDATLRVNGPTPLHVVAETSDGQIYVAESFVKTSGQGACAAPPGTDPKAALATLGDMVLRVGDGPAGALGALTTDQQRLDIALSHPSHSGMQMDQITLLYIPLRYVEDVAIALDGAAYARVIGSISLSENPRLGLSVPAGIQHVGVTMTDTDGTTSRAETRLPGY
ncbi:quinoprotein dehydrogenase-associated SoxYZ-like carrier [Roseivivax sp. CAU 1761]